MDEKQIQQLIALLVQTGKAQDENEAMQILQAANGGDQAAVQLVQDAIAVAQNASQGQSPIMRMGAKIRYMQRLKKICPEGEELVYFKAGGKVCKACMGKRMKCGGKSMQDGGKTPKKKVVIKNDTTKCAKGGILANKGTAFGDGTKGANPRNTDHGGHKSHGNTKAASYMKKTNIPNKFTAFGDTGKAKPTNVGLVGHKAKGQVSRLQSKYTTSDNVNKHTAFGGHINKQHRQKKACPSTKGWKKIKGMPKGHGVEMGWKRYANGGTLTATFFKNFTKPAE